MSRSGLNHRVPELFIDYLYSIHVTVENIPERINGRSECAPGPGLRGGSTEVRTTEGSSALREGEGNLPIARARTVE